MKKGRKLTMVDYSVRRYSKELNWAIYEVLIRLNNAEINYPYYDFSRVVEALSDLKTLIDSILCFPGLKIEWSDYHSYLDKLVMFESTQFVEKRLLRWYLLKYREQHTLKFKRDLMNYYELLECIVTHFAEWRG